MSKFLTGRQYRGRTYASKKQYSPRRSTLERVETVEGETIEQKVRRMFKSGEPIKDGAPEIYTERKDGVSPMTNIRTDRFELAAAATETVTKAQLAKRDAKGKVVKLEPDTDTKKDGGNEVGKA